MPVKQEGGGGRSGIGTWEHREREVREAGEERVGESWDSQGGMQ